MIFFARIRPGSMIDRQWKQTRRAGGTVAGVIFSRTVTGVFEAKEISADDMRRLRSNPNVQVEIVSGLAPVSPVSDVSPAPAVAPASTVRKLRKV